MFEQTKAAFIAVLGEPETVQEYNIEGVGPTWIGTWGLKGAGVVMQRPSGVQAYFAEQTKLTLAKIRGKLPAGVTLQTNDR